jgi:hypothetical protein
MFHYTSSNGCFDQRFSVGNPAFCHACHPPTSALAFVHPAFFNWSAARALVASSIQAQ